METRSSYNENKKNYSINYIKTQTKRVDVKFTKEVYSSLVEPLCEQLNVGMVTLLKYALVEYILNHKEGKQILKNENAKKAMASLIDGMNRQRNGSLKKNNNEVAENSEERSENTNEFDN